MNSKAWRTGDAVSPGARERRWTPFRAAPPHAADRSRGGNRDADAALGASATRRRPIGVDRRRAGAGKLAPDSGVSRPIAGYATHLGGVELFAAPAEYPLHPIAEWGRVRFGGTEVPPEQRLADLENSLAQVKLDPVENAALLAPLLEIPVPAQRASSGVAELRRQQLAALTNWVMAGARVQPVVLALEDVHWADPTTLDALRGIAERGALAPMLVSSPPGRSSARLEYALASQHDFTFSAGPPSGAADGWRACRPPSPAE